MNVVVILFLLPVLAIQISKCYDARYLKTRHRTDLDEMVELTETVCNIRTASRTACLSACINVDKCLTFFYNNYTERCVMHSKDFIWQTPSKAKPGWKFYIIIDVSKRCPPPNYFYRHLNFCYNVNTISSIHSDKIRTSCTNQGGKVATITNQEFQDYFSHFLNGRSVSRVFLGGTVLSKWKVRLDNGTVLNYYNWYYTQPDQLSLSKSCFELYTYDKWYDMVCVFSRPAVYVCEI